MIFLPFYNLFSIILGLYFCLENNLSLFKHKLGFNTELGIVFQNILINLDSCFSLSKVGRSCITASMFIWSMYKTCLWIFIKILWRSMAKRHFVKGIYYFTLV